MSDIRLESFSRQWDVNYIELFRNTFLQPPWNEYWSRERTEKYLKKTTEKKGFTGLVILSSHNPVGFITGYTSLLLKHVFYIDQLFIDCTFPKKGLGRKILQEYLRLLKSKGIKTIWLKTLSKSPAESFYKKMGFQSLFRIGKFRVLIY